jgi:hypothetical protein
MFGVLITEVEISHFTYYEGQQFIAIGDYYPCLLIELQNFY